MTTGRMCVREGFDPNQPLVIFWYKPLRGRGMKMMNPPQLFDQQEDQQEDQEQKQQWIIQEMILDIFWQYPELQNDEEQIRKTPYDVMRWYHYLEHIDECLFSKDNIITTTTTTTTTTMTKTTSNMIKTKTIQENDYISFRIWIGQRSVQQLPNSYKLWKSHLDFVRRKQQQQHYYDNHHHQPEQISSSSSSYTQIQFMIQLYEQCLQETTRMHKMPRIWKDYIEWYQSYPETMENITQWRHLVHRALQSLPVTQHGSLWTSIILPLLERQKQEQSLYDSTTTTSNCYIPYIPSETVLRLLRRYCTLDPSYRTRMAQICLQLNRPAEAAELYYQVLNDCEHSYTITTTATSTETTILTRYDLWMAFSDVVCHYPLECQRANMDVSFETLIRAVLQHQHQQEEEEEPKLSQESHKERIHNNNNHTSDSTEQTTSKGIQFNVGEMEGILWAKLATYFIRLGNFDMARSIYEEGMEAVSRVRDFSILYDAYSQLEEGILEAMMSNQSDEDDEDEDTTTTTTKLQDPTLMDIQVSKQEIHENVKDDDNDDDEEEDWDILVGPFQPSASSLAPVTNRRNIELEWALARAEYLTARRPLLLNRVLLRQNPHNVSEWLTRAKLYTQQGHLTKAIATLQESFHRVQSNQAIQGSPSQLVLELVRLYEEVMGDVDKARTLLRQLCHEQYYGNKRNNDDVNNHDDDDDVEFVKKQKTNTERYSYHFHRADDLAKCHVGWIELELRHEQWDEALSLARQAVAGGKTSSSLLPAKVAQGLVRSPQLWDLLLDLEESLGTVATTRDSYHRAMELQVATPLHVLNFSSYLKDRKYWEESFAAYERGLAMFQFPASKVLWMSYLQDFLERYQGTQIERVRDLFDRCLEGCPPEDCSEFFLLQGDFEETYGLTRRALGVYRSMCQKIPPTETLKAYRLFIAKTTKYLGITATRSVYEDAIAALQDDGDTAQICLDFAQMECSLLEMDRARAVYSYGASMADPRQDPKYWKAWHDFEVAHGNEMTFRDMLRIKRSVQASFATTTIHHPYADTGEGQIAASSTTTATSTIPLLDELPMDPEQAVRQLAEQEGVEWEEDVSSQALFQQSFMTGATAASAATTAAAAPNFVPPSRSKRTRADMLQDMEDQVAKLRHVSKTNDNNNNNRHQNDNEEIDIDNLSDSDTENTPEDTEENNDDNNNEMVTKVKSQTSNSHVKGVMTKEVPAAVFGGLIPSATTSSKS
jgi:pre-mRNA-splicing factor SYF1